MRHRDEKYQRLHAEFRNTMESIAILLSLPTRFVEAHESTIKDRIREILSDNKDKAVVSTKFYHEILQQQLPKYRVQMLYYV